MENTVINWSKAVQEAKEQNEKQEIQKAHYLEEFLTSNIGILDASDIHFYAEMTGISANELRRRHPNKNFEALITSFENDDTDDFIDFF